MRPSPNFGERRDGLQPRFIVLHYTAMATADAALERLCDPQCELSCHYLIDSQGTLYQLVPEDMRAWHAGAGSWRGCDDINSASIGIELANSGTYPFAAAQMNRLEEILADLISRHGIAAADVIAHSDMAPARKSDPGARFDWARLARQGLAAATPDHGKHPVDAARFVTELGRAGYTAEAPPEALLAALRLRHRPAATGPLSPQDMGLAVALARAVVDRTG